MPDEPKDTPKTTPPETPPPIITQLPKRGGKQWITLFAYMAVALIVATGVVFGGRWVYNQVRNEPSEETKETTPTTTTNKAPEPPAAAPSQTSPTPPPSASNQGREIADTGPGEVAALFVTASLVAAGLHYIYRLRHS